VLDLFYSGDCESVKLLLAKGAYVDPMSTFGTPLHLAAKEGQDGTMKILLDNNADVSSAT
ncbi:Os03g0621400, partial [Oryza sativa Japonica Group]